MNSHLHDLTAIGLTAALGPLVCPLVVCCPKYFVTEAVASSVVAASGVQVAAEAERSLRDDAEPQSSAQK